MGPGTLKRNEIIHTREPPKTLDMIVKSRAELEPALDATVERLLPAAMQAQSGIQVIRTGVGSYTAAVRKDIPSGTSVQIWTSA